MFLGIFIAYFLIAVLISVFKLIGLLLELSLELAARLAGWLIAGFLIMIVKLTEWSIKLIIIIGIPLITFIIMLAFYTIQAIVKTIYRKMCSR